MLIIVLLYISQETCTPIISNIPNKIGAYYLFNHVDLEITYHSGKEEEWGVGFGDNEGRIISAKVKFNKGGGSMFIMFYLNFIS